MKKRLVVLIMALSMLLSGCMGSEMESLMRPPTPVSYTHLCNDTGMPGRVIGDASEIFEVLGVGAGIACFQERDAHGVQQAGNGQLILQGKGNAFSLSAVAQGGIKNLNGLGQQNFHFLCQKNG